MPKPAQKMFKEPLGFVELYALCVIGLNLPYNDLIAKNESAKAKFLVENWQEFSELDLVSLNAESADSAYPDGRIPKDKLWYLRDLQDWCKGVAVDGKKPDKPDYFSGKYASELEEMERAFTLRVEAEDKEEVPAVEIPKEEAEVVQSDPQQELSLDAPEAQVIEEETKARTIHELKARMSGQTGEMGTRKSVKKAVRLATKKKGLSKTPLDIAAKDVEALKSLATTITQQSAAIEATFQSVQKLRGEVYPKAKGDAAAKIGREVNKRVTALESDMADIKKALVYLLNNATFEGGRDAYFVLLDDVPEVEDYMDIGYAAEEEE